MRLFNAYFILIILLVHSDVSAAPVFKDTAQVMRQYDYESGLTQVTITAIEQDQLGYIWVGTQAGLNRFDGHEFKHFSDKQGEQGYLSGGFITSLCHSGKKLWIGSSTGLSLYHTQTGQFHSFLKKDHPEILSDRVRFISCKGPHVAVSTEEGNTFLVNKVSHDVSNLPLEGEFIRFVHMAEKGYLYLTKSGLMYTSFETKHSKFLLEGNFAQFTVSGERVYLINSDQELLVFDTLYDKLLWKKKVVGKSGAQIYKVSVNADEILLATNYGVYSLDLNGFTLHHWYKRTERDVGLRDNNVLSVFRDSNLDLWIGTESRGLHFFTHLSESFGHVNEFNYSHAPLKHPDVRSFALDYNRQLWIGTSSGVFLFDGRGFTPAHIKYPELSVIRNTFITQIKFHNDTLWLASRGKGAIRFSLETGELLQMTPEFGNGPELSYNDIMIFKNQILFSSRSLGLTLFDEKTKSLTPYFNDDLSAPQHTSSMENVEGSLWFGTIGEGIYREKNGELEHLSAEQGLASNLVFMIEQDPWGRVWVGSEQGVSVVSPEFEVLRVVNDLNGLNNHAIWGLVYDGLDHMWLGTSGGLARINIHSFEIDNFLPVDGIQGYEFNYNAAWRAPDGRIFMGGANGFNQFFPNKVIINRDVKPLVISNIDILGNTVRPDTQGILTNSPEMADKLTLDYQQNIVSLLYSSLDYSSEKMRFFYRVRGLSEQWLQLSSGTRQVSLIKLEPNTYQIEAYTINRFNQHSPIHYFELEVKAPWWWNLWSKSLYIAFLLTILTYSWRIKQQRFRQVVADNQVMTELQHRLDMSLWASGDELWDWHLDTGEIYRYSISPRLSFGDASSRMSLDHICLYVHPKDCIALEEKVRACIKGETDMYEMTMRVKDNTGNWVWVLERGKVIEKLKDGEALRIAGALKDISELKSHQQALQTLNEQLEVKVTSRTEELSNKNEKLQFALQELQKTQQELIESEKMASLGNVVAGVAHEINTPLGVAITALSFNEESLQEIADKLSGKTLKQSDLEHALVTQREGYDLIMRNLERAESLIGNFKQVAVDQSSEVERDINLKQYVKDVFESLMPLAKGKKITLDIQGHDEINILTYPGAIYQILTNLFKNSILHGFEHTTTGKVSVNVYREGGNWLIDYEDDGCGMDSTMLKSFFDPFVTSKRGQGGCGLGMNIVYNLVTQLLKGEIRCESAPAKGIQLKLKVPLVESKELAS